MIPEKARRLESKNIKKYFKLLRLTAFQLAIKVGSIRQQF